MMSGRAGSRPVFSLLAFQDIITSVSGILMFIVLMLSLELSNEAASSSPVIDRRDLERLESSVLEARQRREQLEQSLNVNDDDARELAALAPEQLKTDVRDLERQIERLTKSTDSLAKRRDALLSEKATVTATVATEAETNRQATQRALKEAAELAKELSDVKSDDRPVFTLPRGFNRSGWLVVVSPNQCDAAPLGQRSQPRSIPIRDRGLFSSSPDLADFSRWVDSLGPNVYLLVIVRPGGAAAFEAIKSDLELRGVSFGFDLAGAGRKLLDSERGASQ